MPIIIKPQTNERVKLTKLSIKKALDQELVLYCEYCKLDYEKDLESIVEQALEFVMKKDKGFKSFKKNKVEMKNSLNKDVSVHEVHAESNYKENMA